MSAAAHAVSEGIGIAHLSHRYPGAAAPALDDVSLEIPAGSSFGLLGPNGAGKTTLLSILMGLQRPQSGTVRVAGLDVARATRRVRGLSALVPQDQAFYLQLSGLENLRFFADVYGLSAAQWRDRLDYVTRVCGLQELLGKRSQDYSGGMKRRLNLAIGLLNAPRILYLDEPTVGIDAISRQVIIAAIQALRATGTTLIYTSHYMEEVEAICDQIAVINHGRVMARDSTANLLHQKAGKTLLLRFAAPPGSAALAALAGWSPVALPDGQYELMLRDAGQLALVVEACRAHWLQIEQLQFGVSRLERIYLELLK
ncbi:MAG TPA: ABC transporter ATP-binding protein [Steroidobacteraceae bacterium]|nr:ABC transporter ATP-binding protein [Steroidobacteraceae bacterium]